MLRNQMGYDADKSCSPGIGATVMPLSARTSEASDSDWPRPDPAKPDADRLRSCAAILSNNSKCRPIRRLGGADHLDACSAPQTARPSQYPANSLDRLMTLQGVCMRLASAKPDASATARLRNPELDLSQLVTVEPRAVSGVAKIIHTTLARLRRGGFHEYD